MRIAVIIKDRCHPDKCHEVCIKFCPRVRAGFVDTIKEGPDGKPVISEDLCIACGICINKCPFDAIKILGLPEELEGGMVHRYGQNGFRLFNLPLPRRGKIVGLLGQNGLGKSTALNILGGQIIPNLGEYGNGGNWDEVIERFEGSETGEYFKDLSSGRLTHSLKPQYVDLIPKAYRGTIGNALLKNGSEDRVERFMGGLDISSIKNKGFNEISGGELQRVAIAASLIKEADVYLLDEPSSYLDIYQRLRVANVIREVSREKSVLIVEHDLAILDYLADDVHLTYGDEGAYGVVTPVYRVRNAINIYLRGYLPSENIRFRDVEITFEKHPPRKMVERSSFVSFGRLLKRYGGFELMIDGGELYGGEVVGVVGPNAIGKTTFIGMLAGIIEPTDGEIVSRIRVSYKPQYLRASYHGEVRDFFSETCPDLLSPYNGAAIIEPLGLKGLLSKNLSTLSGGELQRAAIALCLGRDADLYLIDEPSAYLDSAQRMGASKVIKRVVENRGRCAYVVDHDIYFIDMLADELMVFEGIPGKTGRAIGPLGMREGMNRFFGSLGVSFRRDEETNRPRVNKPESKLDREQKGRGEYYYTDED